MTSTAFFELFEASDTLAAIRAVAVDHVDVAHPAGALTPRSCHGTPRPEDAPL